MISLSSDLTKLQYMDAGEQTTWQVLRGPTSHKLSSFKRISIGGATENLKKHRQLLRRQQIAQRQLENPNDAETLTVRSMTSAIYAAHYGQDGIFHPWKCISLHKAGGSTLDLVIEDDQNLVAFYHACFRLLHDPPLGSKYLREMKQQRIRHKINFEAKASQISVSQFFQVAIFKTLLDKQRMAAADLQKAVKLDKQAFHALFYKLVDSSTNLCREPTENETVGRLANMIRHYTSNLQDGVAQTETDRSMFRIERQVSSQSLYGPSQPLLQGGH